MQSQPISMPSGMNVKQIYAMELQNQIDQKKHRQLQEKQIERMQDVQMILGQQDYFGRPGAGAPAANLRQNPSYPSIQSSLQADDNPYRSLQSRATIQNQSMINLPTQPFMPQQQLNNNQSTIITKPIADPVLELQKRQKQLELQRDLLQQITDRQHKKEEDKLRIKRERILEEERLQREREEIDKKLQMERGSSRLEMRNLQETLQAGGDKNREKRLATLKYQNELLEQQNLKLAHGGRPKRQRTPVEQVERQYHDDQDSQVRTRIEQRIIRELPVEVERTVKETVNVELQRLRAEMNLQTNNVAEQLIALKGQLLQANEAKAMNDEQVRRLKEELRQTQIVDEIRQRELYQAFLGQKQQPYIKNTTERLMTPDSIKFGFPRRPRPYYNMADPYLSPHDTIKDDIHALLHDTTHLIPSKDEGFNGAVTSIPREENEAFKLGRRIENDLDLPDDYYNRQRLYEPKVVVRGNINRIHDPFDQYRSEYLEQENNRALNNDLRGIINNYNSTSDFALEEDEVKGVLKRYEEKYKALEEIDAARASKQLNYMDDALVDLITQQTQKYETKEPVKPFEYNDYYFPDFGDINFNNRLGQIYAK